MLTDDQSIWLIKEFDLIYGYSIDFIRSLV